MILYQINQEISNLVEMPDGEEKTYLESQLKLNLQEQVEEMTKAIRNEEVKALAVDDEIKRLSELKKQALARAESIKRYILMSMQKSGLKKAEFANFTVSIAKTPAKVIVENEVEVPAEYWVEKTTHQIDKMKLKEALKLGEVDGAKLEAGEALRIK